MPGGSGEPTGRFATIDREMKSFLPYANRLARLPGEMNSTDIFSGIDSHGQFRAGTTAALGEQRCAGIGELHVGPDTKRGDRRDEHRSP
jgi:hypothetical protein